MLQIVAPIFAVILAGYLFALWRGVDKAGTRLLNEYVLYGALPALLFVAVARADPAELQQWSFMGATLAGIAAAFVLGALAARLGGTAMPQATIPAMAASYGTTGYLGVPILITALGTGAAVPAAIATILHNVPVIMTVILLNDLLSRRGTGGAGGGAALAGALKATLTNPLTVAVVAGVVVSVAGIPLPVSVALFADFLGAAAGPTALFALGLGLAQLDASALLDGRRISRILPLIAIKVVIQPLVTFAVAIWVLGMETSDLWFVAALIMAAQPIGAGVFVFASKYQHFEDETSVAIIASLIVTLVTLPILLALYAT
ncbi:AEC family transporter [Salinarimonas chemoclinalis]|uniref:AEC family transporter n=1 Tax=Salinarimonas chemoclinalis TaxID=3241599 RepID=UPI003557FFD1